ncbi:hypothetical protein DS745_03890 [Anaerobacillus alkaliphilus]|uniref:Uncharacterized protein n=1 Tax=Anaerobacillus alkaliphilus TaxID=1548597 RepID=A0A4Q0VXW1_9BACI|nr:hypothetical protein [Anaerobacillus alkaliphilus]RXJ04534.1 hypothetical protein DS745_03890 [Anaerobacillus alkaliphilus]
MKRNVFLWLAFLILGVYIIALPDDGPRWITFSEVHGPGFVDLIGIVLVIIGWLLFVKVLWDRRSKLLHFNGGLSLSIVLLLFGFSFVLIVASVASDFLFWWVVGIIIVNLIQVLCLLIVSKWELPKYEGAKGDN